MRAYDHRLFERPQSDLGHQWEDQVETGDDWKIIGPIGLGESGSFRACRSDGVLGVAKPAFQTGTDTPRAAHEKIASDLAYTIDLPVPPVTLWHNQENQQRYAISANAFSQPANWDQAKTIITQEKFWLNLCPSLAAGYVFHSWIADADHGGNGGNILINLNSTEETPSLALIDHAFSLSYSWATPAGPCHPIGAYYVPISDLPQEAIAECVKRVQSVSAERIRQVIERIPPAYLTEERARIIEEGLNLRRDSLAAAFGV